MPPRRLRKVSITTRQIHTSSQQSLLSSLLVTLLIPPLYGLYSLYDTDPRATFFFLIYLALINMWTCALYWYDKAKSRVAANQRVSEKSLHLSELMGGWPAALFSQRFFRHKTHKVAYQAVFWIIVLGHELAWCLWILETGPSS